MADIDAWDILATNNGGAAPNGWPEGTMTLGEVNNTGREVMAVVARWYADNNGSLATTNSGNNYSLTLNRTTVAAYAAGLTAVFQINSTNTGDVTLNINSIGAKSVVYADGSEIPSGEWAADKIAAVVYDATNDWFQLINPLMVPFRNPLTTRGDIITQGASVYGRLAIGAAQTYFRSDGTDPSWSTLLASDLTIGSIADGDILQAASGFFGKLAIGTANQLLAVNAGATAVEYRDSPVADLGGQTLSGASAYEWTTVPSGALEIVMAVSGASLTGTNSIIVQLGYSGGYETTGYSGYIGRSGYGPVAYSTGFTINVVSAQTTPVLATIRLHNIGSNTWVATIIGDIESNIPATGSGRIVVSGVVDRIRITVSGSDTFDAGTAYVYAIG
jgi:hypothetical protein